MSRYAPLSPTMALSIVGSNQKYKLIRILYEFRRNCAQSHSRQPFMPDDHSKLVPLLPIPNRTVKRLRADDSADSRVKVGHRQAPYTSNHPTPSCFNTLGGFVFI